MTACYTYHWSPFSKTLTVAYSKDAAQDSGDPRKVAHASSYEDARKKADAHYTKACRMAEVSGREMPSRLMF